MRILLLVVLLFQLCSSYKVLVYSSKFGYSHMNFLGSMADTLHRAGHQVTILQPVIDRKVRGTGAQEVEVISIEPDAATLEAGKPMEDPELWKMIWTVNTKNPIGVVIHSPKIAKIFGAAMRNTISQKDIMDRLRKKKFDIGIAEMFDYSAFPVFYELGITNIVGSHSTVLTDRTSYATGIPILPSFVPPMQSSSGDDGSLWSRLSNVVFTLASGYFEKTLEGPAQAYMDEHYPKAPKIQELVSNMSFIFVNSEPLIDFPRPKLHKIVDIGGIGLKPAKKLDEDWIKILSKRKRNVLISFGSVAPSFQMPQEYKDNILRVAQEFPDTTFIWKYEHPEDGTGKGVENVHLSKWTPQSDILASGKLDLFVTHGGAGSILESASCGVPLTVIPLFGDQHRNALMAQRFGSATVLNKEHIPNFSELKSAIEKGLGDKKIKESARASKQMLASRPFSPQELLIKHMDLVAKFGSLPSLSPTGRNFTFIQYHNLDVYALLLGIFIGLLGFVLFILKTCCCSSKRTEKIKKQ